MNNENSHSRKPWLAALLSLLFPGLGHMYCGRLVRALLIEFVALILFLVLIPLLLQKQVGLFFLLSNASGVGIALFAIIDSWWIAKKTSPDYKLSEVNRIPAYILFVVLISVLFTGPAIFSAMMIRNELEAFRIAGNSMLPSLKKEDHVLVQKKVYFEKAPQNGDVVAFRAPHKPAMTYVKRVVALPGEKVEINESGALLVDGKVAVENVVRKEVEFRTLEVPPHHVYVLGDAADNSVDSRDFGPVAISSIVGRVAWRYWPPHQSGKYGQGFTGDMEGLDLNQWLMPKNAGLDFPGKQ